MRCFGDDARGRVKKLKKCKSIVKDKNTGEIIKNGGESMNNWF